MGWCRAAGWATAWPCVTHTTVHTTCRTPHASLARPQQYTVCRVTTTCCCSISRSKHGLFGQCIIVLLSPFYLWCQIDLTIFPRSDIFCLPGLCRLESPCFRLPALFNPGLPIPPLISTCIAPPSLLSLLPRYHFLLLIPPSFSHFILSSLLPPHPFICLSLFLPIMPYLFRLSVCCHAFIPPSYPPCPISSHFSLFLSSVSPLCQFRCFSDDLSETVLPKQCTKCHFQKPASNSCSSKTPPSSLNWRGNMHIRCNDI